MKLSSISVSLLLVFFFILTSCKKEKDNPAPPVTTTTREIPPREATGKSTLQPKTVIEQDTFDVPSNVKLEGQEKADIEILTGTGLSGGRSQANYLGWYVEKVRFNGTDYPATTVYAFFFHPDGYYDYFDVNADEWTWGTWYIDPNFNYIAFDLNTQNQEIWKIELISTSRLVILDLATKNQIVFNSFDYATEDKGSFDVTSKVQMLSKKWNFYTYYKQYEGGDLLQIPLGCAGDDVLDFRQDGTLISDQGTEWCDGQTSQTVYEWWSFSEDETELIYTEAATGDVYYYNIERFTAEELLISAEELDENGQYYTAYYQFVPIN